VSRLPLERFSSVAGSWCWRGWGRGSWWSQAAWSPSGFLGGAAHEALDLPHRPYPSGTAHRRPGRRALRHRRRRDHSSGRNPGRGALSALFRCPPQLWQAFAPDPEAGRNADDPWQDRPILALPGSGRKACAACRAGAAAMRPNPDSYPDLFCPGQWQPAGACPADPCGCGKLRAALWGQPPGSSQRGHQEQPAQHHPGAQVGRGQYKRLRCSDFRCRKAACRPCGVCSDRRSQCDRRPGRGDQEPALHQRNAFDQARAGGYQRAGTDFRLYGLRKNRPGPAGAGGDHGLYPPGFSGVRPQILPSKGGGGKDHPAVEPDSRKKTDKIVVW